MLKLGIMQGRLGAPDSGRFQSFPRTRWRDEFALAAAAGLDTIEWIYDAYGEDVNPLGTAAGIAELGRLAEASGVKIESVCADWFMDRPLLRVDAATRRERWARLEWLMHRCALLGIGRIVVPFVDASDVRDADEAAQVAAGVSALSPLIERTNVELHLETSLAPQAFATLLEAIGDPRVRVNYDSGNSSSLGFKPAEEFQAYGGSVGSVHIKDRRRGGGTVPLGEGDTDFAAVFAGLKSASYTGDFILQVARGAEGDELAWTRGNVLTARKWLRLLEAA